MKYVGQDLPHESARLHVTGEALYTDDLVTRFPGCLHAWPVQSPHAHARVLGVDASAAEATPGFVRLLDAGDVPGEGDTGAARKDEPLFPNEACYEGQPVRWALAETEEAARLAATRVVVEWEVLPAVLGVRAAIEAESYLADEIAIRRGDVASALEGAPHRLSFELLVGGQEQLYLETQAALVDHDENGQVVVHSSTQNPTETQVIVARVLGLPRSRVTCQSLRMGGGFGGKETQANPIASVAAVGAHVTHRPVRVRLDRQRDISSTGKRHPFLGRLDVGFDDAGKLVAVDAKLFADGGYSLDLTVPIAWRALFHLDNAYLLPSCSLTARAMRTNVPSNTAFRGFGGPQGMLMIEEAMDRVARALDRSPLEVREANFYVEGDKTPYGLEVRHPERIRRVWDGVLESSEYEARRAEVDAFNAAHEHTKRGLAITPVKFGISFTTAFFNQAGALVLIYADGSVQLNHGGTEMGQGLHTKMRQIAAQELGVLLDDVRLMPTRTDKVPNTSATAASSGADLNGAAVRDACQKLRARLAEVAAAELGAAVDELSFEDACVFVASSPTRSMAFGELAQKAYLERVQLSATGYYKTPEISFDEAAGRGRPFHYFAYGAAVSEVEIDGFTGQHFVRRADILHDVGDSLSPLLDRGQIEGAFVQGMGWLTREELRRDAKGRLGTRGLSTYKIPGADDMPKDFRVALLPRATEPGVVHGSKAVGEPPLMLAISVREALRDAVAAFGDQPSGEAVELATPATPEAVWRACRAIQGR
ncbi:MAG: xanthine dehydrogenase molybdopterin binding subunit [Deltaproteobacteria bacterium]|nr:xanthine dehydrogenase molybdopterin binding subunit [Deltaproteobacteria bacterium]